jgi:putative toxin-antitoxin system antitoxin component (TIGR02293 family)
MSYIKRHMSKAVPNRQSKPTTGANVQAQTPASHIKQGDLDPEQIYSRALELLGYRGIVGRTLGDDPLKAHYLLMEGIPFSAVDHLAGSLRTISIERALGMSARTRQRREKKPKGTLNHEQTGRAWKFAELLAKAMAVFGSQSEAELWFERPAIGLDQQRPIDLLATPAGVKIVEDHLDRLAYGVYA